MSPYIKKTYSKYLYKANFIFVPILWCFFLSFLSTKILCDLTLGYISYSLPNLFNVSIYFNKIGAPYCRAIVSNLFLGEVVKIITSILLSIFLLITIVHTKKWFIFGYFFAIIFNVIASMLFNIRRFKYEY